MVVGVCHRLGAPVGPHMGGGCVGGTVYDSGGGFIDGPGVEMRRRCYSVELQRVAAGAQS